MKYENVLTHSDNGITTITINRPSKLNALNKVTIKELHEAFKEADNDKATRVILVTGSGEKAFVAGADISEFADYSVSQGAELASQGQALLFDFVAHLSTPVILLLTVLRWEGALNLPCLPISELPAIMPKWGYRRFLWGLSRVMEGHNDFHSLLAKAGPSK